MNRLKYCLTELTIIFMILFFSWQADSQEGQYLFRQDIGTIIISVAALWGIGAFLRITNNWSYWSTSLMSALGLVIFGAVLHEVGFCTAITVTGFYLFILTGLISPFLNRTQTLHLFILAVSCISLGGFMYIASEGTILTEPSKNYQPQIDYDIPIDSPDAVWDLQIEYVGYLYQIESTSLSYDEYFTGTEEEAIAETKRRSKEWQSAHPDNGITKFSPVLQHVPEKWKREKGWDTF